MDDILYHNGINNILYYAQHTNCRCVVALDGINTAVNVRRDNS